jgi:hypothetical protein
MLKKGLLFLFALVCFLSSCEKWDIDYERVVERNKIAGLWFIDSCEWGHPSANLDSPNIRIKDVFDINNRPFFLVPEVNITAEFPCSTNIYGYSISFFWYAILYRDYAFGESNPRYNLYFSNDSNYEPSDSDEINFFTNIIRGSVYEIREHINNQKLVVCYDMPTWRGKIKNCFYLSQ